LKVASFHSHSMPGKSQNWIIRVKGNKRINTINRLETVICFVTWCIEPEQRV
jgi:hypothetical protein